MGLPSPPGRDAAGGVAARGGPGGCWKVRKNLDGTLADDNIAAAIVDRVVHHGRLVELSGPSHRPEEPLMLRKSGSLDAPASRTEMLA